MPKLNVYDAWNEHVQGICDDDCEWCDTPAAYLDVDVRIPNDRTATFQP